MSLSPATDTRDVAAAPATLPEVLRRRARLHGGVEAVVDGSSDGSGICSRAQRVTHRDLQAAVERVAAALQALGVAPGDAVGVRAPNSVRWALVALGRGDPGDPLLLDEVQDGEGVQLPDRERRGSAQKTGEQPGEQPEAVEERVHQQVAPPTLYASLLNAPSLAGRDLFALRLAVTGASVVPRELIRRMRDELGLREVVTAYGLTEAGGVVTMCRLGDPGEVVSATSGRAVDGVEVRIAPTTTDTGEILVRGFNVMSGYRADPAATAAAVDPDGWLHTGDAGRMDDAGNVTVTGRLDDMFVVGGFNVSPAEVEQLLCRHPAVSEAAVVVLPELRRAATGKVAKAALGQTAR
ncbi:hypothetical protein GCM10023175_24230 [Pseudonocardia xishanensis]|uniref:AMP-dependent synthetase/ligase domain-containing protein n=1 Tax=Pseudonocardia xishanensis TaxID=630995 RepID=A0ABP8RQI3_9PSEU